MCVYVCMHACMHVSMSRMPHTHAYMHADLVACGVCACVLMRAFHPSTCPTCLPTPLSTCSPVLPSSCPPVLLSSCPPVHLSTSCPPVRLLCRCHPGANARARERLVRLINYTVAHSRPPLVHINACADLQGEADLASAGGTATARHQHRLGPCTHSKTGGWDSITLISPE